MLKFYLAKGEKTWGEVARRVSQLMPLAEQDEVEEAITQGLFYPGTPILRNAGSALNMSSCHSWIVGNSIDEIFEAASVAAKVFKSGGGGLGWICRSCNRLPPHYATSSVEWASDNMAELQVRSASGRYIW